MPAWTPTPEWRDQDAFLIGGGSSLEKFPFASLDGKNTIGCNDAFRLGPDIVKICLFGDASFFHKFKWDLKSFGGRVVTCAPALLTIQSGWLLQMNRDKHGLFEGNVLGWNFSTGAAAVNLAVTLGAKRIFLLGYDMGKRKDGKSHWHNHRHKMIPDASYARFIQGFCRVYEALKKRPAVQVLNVTDGSSQLPFFDRIDFSSFMGVLSQEEKAA
jgi:hypothetical protein